MIIEHHEAIRHALKKFNQSYLSEHNILFGGGTRIALELDEYRTSIDIDFLCPNKESYRAVRSQATSNSLGNLLSTPLTFVREIRMDRDAVRTVIESKGRKIKLEIVAFDNYNLKAAKELKWGVPIIDTDSCFITKLLANADRYREPVKKDIIDLIKMYKAWGTPGDFVWDEVDSHYGSAGEKSLLDALDMVCDKPDVLNTTFDVCKISTDEAENILQVAHEWRHHIINNESSLTP